MTTDVLFSSAECKREGSLSIGISGQTHDSTGHLPYVGLRTSKETVNGTPGRWTNAKWLAFPYNDVRTIITRWSDQA